MAQINVFDPQVKESKIYDDLDSLNSRNSEINKEHIDVYDNPYDACKGAHCITILTEWDEFKTYDWDMIFMAMEKPAFIFDGRNILDKQKLENIGFIYHGIGK